MRKRVISKLMMLAVIAVVFYACEDEAKLIPENEIQTSEIPLKGGNGFMHGVVVDIDGEDYYFMGPADGPNGERDVPGHEWSLVGKNRVNGKHYNSGPNGAPQWWSSDAPDGALLYVVHGIIDEWSEELALEYFEKGYVHRHEFVRVSDGELHPSKVIWLKHTAVTSFTLDGGPMGPNPPYEHWVTPGVDLGFPNNYLMPYPGDGGGHH